MLWERRAGRNPGPLFNMKYSEFKKVARHLEGLEEKGLKFSLNVNIPSNMYWTNEHKIVSFVPLFESLDSFSSLSSIFETMDKPVAKTSFTIADKSTLKQIEGVKGSVVKVNGDLTKVPNTSVNYFFPGLWDKYKETEGGHIPKEDSRLLRGLYYLANPPIEVMDGDKTIRTVVTNDGNVIASVSQEHKLYAYLDKGHTLVFNPNQEADIPYIVTNQLNLDVCCLIALYQIYPNKIDEVLRNHVYLPSHEARIALFKCEKALPDKYAAQYKTVKQAIMHHFEANAQSLTLHKLQRGELTEVVSNEIKLAASKAEYEGVSIEATDFSSVVLNRLNSSDQFNIYDIVSIYANNLEQAINDLPRSEIEGKAGGSRFSTATEYSFKINDMPIKVSVTDTSCTRYVNGIRINQDELSRVLNRATCFKDVEKYNLFLTEVSHLSLFACDMISNGQPAKLSETQYEDYHAPKASPAQPKLKYSKGNKGEFFLSVGEDEKIQLHRFIGFLHDVEALNGKANHGFIRDTTHSWKKKDADWFKEQFKKLLSSHMSKKVAEAPVLDEKKTAAWFKWVRETQNKAEARSQVLLDQTIKMTGAVKGKLNGMDGYTVVGKLRTYFINEKDNKTYDKATGRNICIVNGRAEMGVGKDAVVALMLALKNDSRRVDQIKTLQGA